MPEQRQPNGISRALQILMPLEAARPATEADGGGVWIHVLPIGEWPTDYQWPWLEADTIRVTIEDAAEYERNHRAGIPGVAIALDENHWPGPAPGWIQELRAEDDGVWARVEWTPRGEQLIADRDYRYVSPEFWPRELPYPDCRTGREIPNVLVGLALTNRPFFEELPAVARAKGGALICTAAAAPSGPGPDRPAGSGTTQQPGGTQMPDTTPQPNPQETAPAGTGADAQALQAQLAESEAALTSLRAERDALARERDALTAEARRAALRTRLTAIEAGGRRIAPAHVDQLLDRVMAQPDDQRDEMVTAIAATITSGLVATDERGAAGAGDERKPLSAEDRQIMERLGVDEETFRKHNPDYA